MFLCSIRFRMAAAVFGSLLIVGLLFSACKSTPVPPKEELLPSLAFMGVEAEEPGHLTLLFTLTVKNPFPSAGLVKVESWRTEINGQKVNSGFSLDGAESFPITAAEAGAWGTASLPVKLNMDMAALAAQGCVPADDYTVNLITGLAFSFDSAAPVKTEVSGLAAFPGVQAPAFSINAIAILKAELINTRFRVTIKIDNPNPFPVELSAFSYELYGNGRLWADGTEKNIIRLPAKSSVEGNLFLLMNFINMKRDLLDQIIRLEDVNYRFSGEARVSTGVDYLPAFVTGFDLSGYSEVLEN